MTAKLLSTWTMMGVPSARTMCASYTPSASVSTRSIVAPGSLAFAAAVTLSLTVPVSSVSPGCIDRLGS